MCDDCAKACPVKVPDGFNLGLGEVPAIRGDPSQERVRVLSARVHRDGLALPVLDYEHDGPDEISGDYHVIVVADSSNRVFEGGQEANNLRVADAPVIERRID